MIGNKKGIYHSELNAFGPAYVTVKSDVMPSKKKQGTFFVVLEHDGTEQYYNVENTRCAIALKGLKNQSLTIKATGGRDDANIEILNPDGTIQQPSENHVTAQPNQKLELDMMLMKYLNLFYVIENGVKLQHAQSAAVGNPVTDEGYGGKCSSAFRELTSYVDEMPTEPLWPNA